jgi:hypothetical protein
MLLVVFSCFSLLWRDNAIKNGPEMRSLTCFVPLASGRATAGVRGAELERSPRARYRGQLSVGEGVLSAAAATAAAAAAAAVRGAGQYAHETLIAFCIDAAVAGLIGELSTADDDKRGDTGSGTATITFCWRKWGIDGGNRCLNQASGARAAGCSRS